MIWSEDLNEQYRPDRNRVVFVDETPPDPGDAQERFFYSSTLFAADSLFRGLMTTLHDADAAGLAGFKAQWLERFKDDGFWLIDLTDEPVARRSSRERRADASTSCSWCYGLDSVREPIGRGSRGVSHSDLQGVCWAGS